MNVKHFTKLLVVENVCQTTEASSGVLKSCAIFLLFPEIVEFSVFLFQHFFQRLYRFLFPFPVDLHVKLHLLILGRLKANSRNQRYPWANIEIEELNPLLCVTERVSDAY